MRKKFCSCKRTRWSKETRSEDSANTKSNSKTHTVRDSVVTGRQRVQGRVLVGKKHHFRLKAMKLIKLFVNLSDPFLFKCKPSDLKRSRSVKK